MQGLTMIVITAILFKLNVVLAAWTILLIVPLLFVLSCGSITRRKRVTPRAGPHRQRLADLSSRSTASGW